MSFLARIRLCQRVSRLILQPDITENKRRAKIVKEMGMTLEESAQQGRINGESDMTDRQNIHFRYSV